MAVSTLFSPFNFDPEDVQVKAGSFTIPNGQYAYLFNYNDVTVDTGNGAGPVSLDDEQQFNITRSTAGTDTILTSNGNEEWYVTCACSTTGTSVNSSVFIENTGGSLTVNLCASINEVARTGNNTPGIFDGTNTIGNANFSGRVKIPPGFKLRQSVAISVGTSNVTTFAFEVSDRQRDPIFIPEGTIVDGNNYNIVLYDKPL